MRQATTSTDTKEREIVGSHDLASVEEAAARSGDHHSFKRVVQARMAVSSPSDSFEIEAERVADDFVSRSYSSPSGSAPEIEESNTHQISRRTMGDGLEGAGAALETTDETASAISRASSGGKSLDPNTKGRFESGLGADLSTVRIHADGQSDKLCRSLSAEAFTTGSDVFFSSGSYQPGTKSGDHLLAHELTHVVQQGSAPVVSRFAITKEGKETDARAAKMKQERAQQKEAFQAATFTQEEIDEETAVSNKATQTEADEAHDDAMVDVATGQTGEVLKGSQEMDHIRHKGEGTTDTKDGVIVGLATSVKSLVMSVLSLYKAISSGDTDNSDKAEAAANAVKEALGVAENSLKVASTFGGTVGSAAVPGVGIAISAISAGQEVLNIYRGNRDINAMKADRDSTTDANKKIAIDNLISRRMRSYIGAMVNLVGDITMLVGNIGVVATGPGAPWALIVVAAGGLIKAFSSIGQALSRWKEAFDTKKARAAMATAEDQLKQAKTPEEKKAAQEALDAATQLSLRDDAAFAAGYILEKAVSMHDQDGVYDEKAAKIVATYGLSKEWLEKFYASKKSPAMFEQGVDIMLGTAGTSRNPKDFIDSLKATGKAIAGYFTSFWNFITGKKVVDGSPEESAIRIKIKAEDEIFNALVPVLAKYSKDKPPVASKINEKLTKIYTALLATFAPENYKDKKRAAYNGEIIKASAIEMIMGSEGGTRIDAKTIDIKDGKVEFKVKSAA